MSLHAGKENRLPDTPLRRDDERMVVQEVAKRVVLTVKDKSQAEHRHDKPRQPGGQPPPSRCAKDRFAKLQPDSGEVDCADESHKRYCSIESRSKSGYTVS